MHRTVAEFGDRVESARYAGDEPVTVSWGDQAHDVPERLFVRAQLVAQAYELHLLPAIDVYARTALGREQCATLADELAFVAGLLEDALLLEHGRAMQGLAEQCARSGGELVIEGP